MNRIEEVKKILDTFFKYPNNTYPSPKTAELAQEICQLFPQPLGEKRVTCMECMGDKYKKRSCKHCQGKGYLIFVSAQPLADKGLREKALLTRKEIGQTLDAKFGTE